MKTCIKIPLISVLSTDFYLLFGCPGGCINGTTYFFEPTVHADKGTKMVIELFN